MALQNDTFVDLKNLTFALIGREYADTTASFGRLKALWNYAAKKAYRQTNYWERFLVFGEARPIANGNTVQQSVDAYNVSGAGTTEVNGTYVLIAEQFNSHSVWQFTKGTLSYFIRRETHGASNTWHLVQADSYDQATANKYFYSDGNNGNAPDLTGWIVDDDGAESAPTLSDLGDIDTYLRIYLSDPKVSRGTELDFMVNSSGALISGAKDLKGVFVSYKKAYDPDYGNAGDTEAIPSELLPYMAHLAAYTWQRSVEQNSDEANFSLSLALVNSILEDELAKISDQDIANSYLVKNIQTNYNQLII
jgi:hypothetical protein